MTMTAFSKYEASGVARSLAEVPTNGGVLQDGTVIELVAMVGLPELQLLVSKAGPAGVCCRDQGIQRRPTAGLGANRKPTRPLAMPGCREFSDSDCREMYPPRRGEAITASTW
jgi:hypothetical protein